MRAKGPEFMGTFEKEQDPTMLGGQKESGSKEYGAPSLAETFRWVIVSFTEFAVLVGDFGLVVVRFSYVVDPAFLECIALGGAGG